MPELEENLEPTEPDPLNEDDAPLHDPEQDAENIEEEGEPFPGNFA